MLGVVLALSASLLGFMMGLVRLGVALAASGKGTTHQWVLAGGDAGLIEPTIRAASTA